MGERQMNDRDTHVRSDTTATEDRDSGFLSRWSRRKAAVQHGLDVEPEAPLVDAGTQVGEVDSTERGPTDADERIDPRTGKRFAELTDADMPPLESLDEHSDLSMFMAQKVSPALRTKALGKVFRSAKYNKVCQMCEYAGDYTQFQPLGDLLTHDMKAAIVREADRLRQRLLAMDQDISREEAEARVLEEMRSRRTPDNEVT